MEIGEKYGMGDVVVLMKLNTREESPCCGEASVTLRDMSLSHVSALDEFQNDVNL